VRDEPLKGRHAVGGLFAILFRVFEDLRFVGTCTSSDGAEVLHFLWRLGDKEDEGVDMMSFDDDRLIEDYRVTVRPLSAVVALRDAAFSQLPKRPSQHCRTGIPNKVLGTSQSQPHECLCTTQSSVANPRPKRTLERPSSIPQLGSM
jgi:hypothetical protein